MYFRDGVIVNFEKNIQIDKDKIFPPLPLEEWKDTKNTLHLFLQIIGKIRLALFPPLNHWWHVSLYLSPRGLTTRTIPYRLSSFEIELDLINHIVVVSTSNGLQKSFAVYDGLTVADFYKKLFAILSELEIYVEIKALPYKVSSIEAFETNFKNFSYNKEFVERFMNILIVVNGIFEEFRGKFTGKSTPVHLFWHSFDLALTRFSGKRAHKQEGFGMVDREAYSHEVISFGFWAGDDNFPAPAFYSYTYPEPPGLINELLKPKEAYWGNLTGSSIALLRYDEVRKSTSPKKDILGFLESAYQAGGKLAGWDLEKLKRNQY
jgi:Family of unknown function (DUF5996)